MENCCQSIVKYLIFLFNMLFAVTGLGLICLGAYAHFEVNSDLPANGCVLLVVIGFIIFMISFFGCLGSFLENKCMIYTYAIFVIVIALAEMFIVICACTTTMAEMKTTLADYGKPGNEVVDEMWDFAQQLGSCCGLTSYRDWGDNLPASCCPAALGSCNINNTHAYVYSEGCLGKNKAVLTDVAVAVAGSTLLQAVIIIAACWIGRHSGRRNDKEYLMLIERY